MIQTLSDKSGTPPSLICLRSASLPAIEVANGSPLNHLFFWYPYTQGKALIRDFQLIDHAMRVSPDHDTLTAGGYPLAQSEVESIETLAMTQLSPSACTSVFTIHSPEAKRLAYQTALKEQNIPFSSVVSTELRAMARQAELSTPPETDMQCIVQTLLNNPATSGYVDRLSQPELISDQWRERVVKYGPWTGFGILSEPNEPSSIQDCLVIPNTGSGHHCGPNGLHTRLARELCQQGIAAMRFDLRHLGNSGIQPNDNRTDAYCSHAGEDVGQVVSALTNEGYQRPSLFGICAGAHSCFQYLTRQHPLHSLGNIFLVNPNTLYWAEGDDAWQPEKNNDEHEAHYHRQQATNVHAWLNLLKSPSKWARIAEVAVTRAFSILKRLVRSGDKTQNRFVEDCRTFLNAAQSLYFIFSPDEPGEQILEAKGGAQLKQLGRQSQMHWLQLINGDHTFTTTADRDELIRVIRSAFTDASPIKKPTQKRAATVSAIAGNRMG
ncbi:hypothetical protein [Reinekea blandensis]|uniref:Serine aminopeptidase S33 domain-containing protein n=1 Tax=Reinekea blandensis MED297 TaxID=314283 RepID=A4B965_9GAMM|nr:hypothetical protein [Reinekea blandensis]EAR11166.1 hypothetical protein MED297_19802 [Reinekea sp. MED297] [Reinekea blandensis MED297]